MKRRNLIKATLAAVAGLLAPKGRAKHVADAGNEDRLFDFRLRYKDKGLAGNAEARAWLKQFECQLKEEMLKPPAPAPGQVWEKQGILWVVGRLAKPCDEVYHAELWKGMSIWPDGAAFWSYRFGDEITKGRYLGDIRDLARLKLNELHPILHVERPPGRIELGPCGDNSQRRT